jgi:5-methylcytosine-specific restriction endonuclease McrA
MRDTLVLNSHGMPIGFCSWQKAITLVWKERAVIIDEDVNRILRSPSFEMGMPVTIKVRNAWVKRKRMDVPRTRRNFAVRDESTCQYCGKLLSTYEYTLDHVLPRSQGGTTTWENCVIACVKCNKHKANRTPAQAGMRLMKVPVAPKASDPRFNFKLHINKMRPEWKDYAAYLYWNIELDR